MTRQQGTKDLHLVLAALGIEHLPRHCHMRCVKTVVEALQYQGATVDRVIDRSRRHIEKGQGNRHAYVSQDSRQCVIDTHGITRPASLAGWSVHYAKSPRGRTNNTSTKSTSDTAVLYSFGMNGVDNSSARPMMTAPAMAP